MIVVRQLLRATSALARPMSVNTALLNKPTYTFAFMQLFERNKRPAELSPVFKRVTHEKGHLKSKARKQYSKKLNTRVRKPKQKLKNHKGLLKRIKIVGPRWNRQFKFQSPGKNHLRRHKSQANLKRKSRARYVHPSDMRRVKKLIPYYKRRSLKMRY